MEVYKAELEESRASRSNFDDAKALAEAHMTSSEAEHEARARHLEDQLKQGKEALEREKASAVEREKLLEKEKVAAVERERKKIAALEREKVGALQSLALKHEDKQEPASHSMRRAEDFEVERARLVERVSRNLLSRWKNMRVACAYDGWYRKAVRSRTLEKAAQRCALVWLQGHVYRAYLTWRDFSVASARMRRLAGRVLGHWQRKSLSAAFEGFAHSARKLIRQRTSLARVLVRWQNQLASRVFASWCLHAQEQARAQKTSLRVVRHWRNRTLAAAFGRWLEACQLKRRARGLQNTSILRMRNRELWSAFEVLARNASKQRYVRVRAVQVLRGWQHASLLGAWHKWLESRRHFSRMRRVMDTIARRIRNAVAGQAFFGWHAHACAQRRAAWTVARILSRWKQTSLVRAWSKWLEGAKHFRRVQDVMEKAARLLTNGTVSKVSILL